MAQKSKEQLPAASRLFVDRLFDALMAKMNQKRKEEEDRNND